MLTPVGEHELLLFWVQLALLLAAARGLGALFRRWRQPAVVGELLAGLLLGPSVLGSLFPAVAGRLFPGGEVESALLLAVAWLGIVLLLVVTGFETDLRLLRDLGRASLGVSVGSLVVPLAVGAGLGLVLPEALVGGGATRPVFAAFVAVALSISALPVVAKILQDLRLMRRDFGQITVAAGMVNDLVGWLLLGTLISIVHSGGFDPGALLVTVLAIGIFIAGTAVVGQRVVDTAVRTARKAPDGPAATLTVAVLTVLVAGAVTHAIGMEAVIGAFVAGIVLGRSRYLPDATREGIERLTHAVFAPIFFATAGLYVDLGALAQPRNALAALAIVVVAAMTKLVGSYLGGISSGLSRLESLAIGVGLNARGAMEIVLATVGLRLQVLNAASYTAIVLMAMATSLLAPPLLRPILARLQARPEEARRLEREELLASSVIANAGSALLPTRGGANSHMAARMLDLVLQPLAAVTVLSVQPPGLEDPEADERVRAVMRVFVERDRELRIGATARDPAEVIAAEATLGYDLMALGLNEGFQGTHELSGGLQRLLALAEIPVMLVRRAVGAPNRADTSPPIGRILVPVTGTAVGRAAEEIAYVIASRVEAAIDAVHVVSRSDDPGRGAPVPTAHRQLQRSRALSQRFGRGAATLLRSAPVAYEELLATAEDRGSDLIVLGAQIRSHGGRPFLGHGTEYLLEHADQPVVVILFPDTGGS